MPNEKYYRELLEKITEKSFLKKIKCGKRDMQALVREENWKSHVFSILSQENISCVSVLDMCQTVMNRVGPPPEEGWLTYIYYHLVTGLYPAYTSDPKQYQETSRQPAVYFYLETLRWFLDWEARHKEFDHLKDFAFVSEEDAANFGSEQEYLSLMLLCREQYIYEMMRIGREVTAFNILAHIAGVHFVAMHVARQLYYADVPVDLPVVSGAALGHDIGKFGCRPSEADRVPYLHYYYTDEWFRRNHMPSIGHVAVNHSAWDLELENLPVESLILIYADFRVKNKYRNAEEYSHVPSCETIEFFTLKQAFDVILNKLDNVDNYKHKRYSNVYAKLLDFEKYMENLGVDTTLTAPAGNKTHPVDPALRSAQQVIESFKHLAVDHNIRLMSKISDETSFANILEAARSEKNWKNLRAYINIFTEYFTYMTQPQKMLTLDFLYELLMHKEGDIRRQGADLIGHIIATFDVKYRKELPADVVISGYQMSGLKLWEKYIRMILFPDHKVTDQHKRWIGYALKIIVQATLAQCLEEEKRDYLEVLLAHFSDAVTDDLTIFTLLDSMLYLPLASCTRKELEHLARFALSALDKDSDEIKVSALNYLCCASERLLTENICTDEIQRIIFSSDKEQDISIYYLKYCILQTAEQSAPVDMQALGDMKTIYENRLFGDDSPMPALFLINLKIATPWVLKIANIELLSEMLKRHIGDVLHVATHLSNLIKVSERVAVRHRAGQMLLSIAPLLSFDQCNEIAIELFKGLEIGDYAVSKYIPEYLGVLALHLPPRELDELITDINFLLKSTNEKAVTGALNTLSVLLEHYAGYKDRFPEPDRIYDARTQRILGMLLSSLANYNKRISQEAFLVLGKSIFGSGLLTMQELYHIFRQIHKKLLILISLQETDDLAFFNSAAALNHIYRFISNYIFEYDLFPIEENKRVAYFPGTFDPFSLSHKGIVQEIRNLGFEVYLALDEFSWSKRAQARLIRRQIANMSVADEMDVYLFPDDMPINISNKKDLKRLRSLFTGKELYFVAGSDVIMNASAYKAPSGKGDIHDLNHIVFRRSTVVFEGDVESAIIRERINGKLIELTLPLHLEDISSTIIREHIDLGRDISNLIDPLAQNYIYDLGLYLREPPYKAVLKTRSMLFSHLSGESAAAFLSQMNIETARNFEPQVITMRNGEEKDSLTGFSLYHEITTSDLYDEFGSSIVSQYVRSRSVGKITVIRKIRVATDPDPAVNMNHIQFLLTETLSSCLKNNFHYCLYCDPSQPDERVIEILQLQGFWEIPGNYEGNRIYAVDMSAPLVLIKDVVETLKEPFSTHPHVQAVIEKCHHRLQTSLTRAYPGHLVLSFDIGVMHHGIVNKVTRINKVPPEPLPVRKLGAKICVPFGKILRGVAVPNTVTKSLHTEKMFDSRIRRFRIEAYPFYSPLVNQIRTIRSFGRKVILVDDILHKGYRLKELDPIFKQEKLDIDRIVVGIMSGSGRDLMHIQNRKAESVYYIPNLKIWFTESTLYPFIGGDSVRRGTMTESSAPPSINLILPYVSPDFIRGAPLETLFHLSMTCLENTKELLLTLETEYRRLYERNLTLNRLGEVMRHPRCPDTGNKMNYDFNLPPSVYIENDIEKLIRLWGLIR